MEFGERTKRSLVAVAIVAGALAMTGEGQIAPDARQLNRSAVERAIDGTSPIPNFETNIKPESPATTTTSPDLTPASLPETTTTAYQQPTTATTQETATLEQQKKMSDIRNRVIKYMATSPTKELVRLPVKPEVQAIYPNGLFVTTPETDCAAVTKYTANKDGTIHVQNAIFARPKIITNLGKLTGPAMYSGEIGHGDTDAAGILSYYYINAHPNVTSVYGATLKLTEDVCNQIPEEPLPKPNRKALIDK